MKALKFITVQEAADRLSITPKAVYYAIAEGKLTRHEQYGRVLLNEAEVAAYVPRGGNDRPSRRRSKRLAGTA